MSARFQKLGGDVRGGAGVEVGLSRRRGARRAFVRAPSWAAWIVDGAPRSRSVGGRSRGRAATLTRRAPQRRPHSTPRTTSFFVGSRVRVASFFALPRSEPLGAGRDCTWLRRGGVAFAVIVVGRGLAARSPSYASKSGGHFPAGLPERRCGSVDGSGEFCVRPAAPRVAGTWATPTTYVTRTPRANQESSPSAGWGVGGADPLAGEHRLRRATADADRRLRRCAVHSPRRPRRRPHDGRPSTSAHESPTRAPASPRF